MNKWVSSLLILMLLTQVGCRMLNRREKYVEKHSRQLTQEQKETILEGKLYLGMPKEAVIAAIGRPTRVNADFLGHQVVWYYDYDRDLGTRERNVFKETFVVEFKDDKVFNWRED